MFGYVLPQKSEMKVKDFENYRAYYCGVCKQLQMSYGFVSRFFLNYDLVFLAVITDALSGEQPCVQCNGCFANPLAKRCTFYSTKGLHLASDGLVMLTYHKLCDNLVDEGFFKRIGYSVAKPFIRHLYKKAAAKHPQVDALLTQQMQLDQQMAEKKVDNVDVACDPSAKMCSALFALAAQDEAQERILSRLGLFAGQVIYLLDAAEDYPEDKAKGRYNVFVQAGLTHQQAIELTKTRCNMAAGEIARCYNLLGLQQYKPILDNIFFLGVPAGIAMAGTKRNGRPSKHGQIESV